MVGITQAASAPAPDMSTFVAWFMNTPSAVKAVYKNLALYPMHNICVLVDQVSGTAELQIRNIVTGETATATRPCNIPEPVVPGYMSEFIAWFVNTPGAEKAVDKNLALYPMHNVNINVQIDRASGTAELRIRNTETGETAIGTRVCGSA